MDISVSQLNGRLASKLPPELPLGLVFVVGRVSQKNGAQFVLSEGTHRLNCRTNEGVKVGIGEEVRASGHLMFDPQRLQYFLQARDVELISPEPQLAESSRMVLGESEALLTALAEVQSRSKAAPVQENEALPVWVKKLAPPEVESAGELQVDRESPRRKGTDLDERLVRLLAEAMESEEVLEVTPELLAPFQIEPEPVAEPVAKDAKVAEETAVPTGPTSYRPANREETDWLVILLIISFFVLTIAAIVTIILLLV